MLGEWIALGLLAWSTLAVGAIALGQEYAPGSAIAGRTENGAGVRPGLLTPVTAPPTTGDTLRAGGRPALSSPTGVVVARSGNQPGEGVGSNPARGTGLQASSAELARCIVGEGGWHSAADHAAVLHVLERRARASGRSLLEQTRAYANGCKAAWVELDRPKQPELWAAALERVRAFEAGELADPCRGRAEHWGGTVKGTERDQARIAACLAAGKCEVVDCGGTRNTFFRTVAR